LLRLLKHLSEKSGEAGRILSNGSNFEIQRVLSMLIYHFRQAGPVFFGS
jgi:hypothetical protein